MGIRSFAGLSYSLARAEFKLKNEGSYLGLFWYLLSPLLMFLLLLLVFSNRLGNDIPQYPVYLLLGIILFNFFQHVTTESTRAVFEHRGVIKSIRFNLATIVTSIVLKSLFAHVFEILLFAAAMLYYHVPLSGLLFYPFILAVFCAFIFGVSLVLTSLTVYFTDLENIWIFVSRLLWFATPLFYSIGGQDRLFLFNLANPLYYFITAAREAIIYSTVPSWWIISGSIASAILSLAVGWFVFNRLKRKFAEMI